ncbi:MutS domain III [Catalinimonas alkaloidigena]|uniref:MutS domain III n=1 Tax=Catalinimonas alkaloidigena TaxID=1075417 RepID=A0A1G9MMQ9_9BACT|nr:hypothetical protein [Catalinimonas alkaloidigena]SDL75343.1 MutS domain III [Catalinimonas alkaloidigena]
MSQDLLSFFEQRAIRFGQRQAELQQRYNLYATVRVLWFLAVLVLTFYFANVRLLGGVAATLAIGLAGFVIALKRHQQVAHQRDEARHLKEINDEEAARLRHQFRHLPDGAQYADLRHPYTSDLDVFGPHSLFQYLNRTTTHEGSNRLAAWLQYPAEAAILAQRHAALRELSEQLDWRQQVQAAGRHAPAAQPPLLNETPSRIFQEKSWLSTLRWVLPLVTLTLFALVALSILPLWVPLLALLGQILLLRQVFQPLYEATFQGDAQGKRLKSYVALFQAIEQASFSAPLLQRLHQTLTQPQRASRVIADLSAIVQWLDSRANLLYGIFNGLLLIDLWILHRLERWQEHNLPQLPAWLDALAELDALNSLAATHFAHPDWCLPASSDEPVFLEAISLGHPLLPPDRRVTNDLALSGLGETLLITGANMSGKSTFLRTVGAGMVMALAGAPVCAAQMRVSRMQVFTSMRTQDSLEESVSGFYAELKRIRQLLDLLNTTELPIFYMLDEILKGTNSRDRHTGAMALIHQLHRRRASGMVSTHDIELGQLEKDLGVSLKNFSFNSQIVGDEIRFDYHLTPGICRSFNATKLMEQMGIAIDSEPTT